MMCQPSSSSTGSAFPPDNPLNAGLVTETDVGEQEVVVLELTSPVYDEAAGTITYGTTILDEYEGDELAHIAQQPRDTVLPETFGRSSLFIDDCPDADSLNCFTACGDPVGTLVEQGMCWSWSNFGCEPCSGGWSGTADACNSQFAACNGECFTNVIEQCDGG